MKNSTIGKTSVCKKRKRSIFGADIRNIDAPGAEINKLAATIFGKFGVWEQLASLRQLKLDRGRK